jgi:geranylgeranyl diphosphate synthase type II
MHKTLLVLEEIERMARESVEGQAIELDWIASNRFDLDDADYVRMAHKKTCWYTVIAPLRIGVICGHPTGASFPRPTELLGLVELGHLAGIAFQICDDLLNLESEQDLYGKEIAGDLWEGKRTVMLLHFLRTAASRDRARAIALLETSRDDKSAEGVAWLLDAMRSTGSLRYGREMADDYARRAVEVDDQLGGLFRDGDDRRFLREMLRYVVERAK